MVEMRSLSTFHNPKIVRKDGTHHVAPGETFETDWAHGKDLANGKLAEPVDPKAFDKEPTDAMLPHSGISAPDLKRTNDRRAAAAKSVPVAGAKA